MCRCDPTRGQTCARCDAAITAEQAERDGYGPDDPHLWRRGQDDYERQLWRW